MAEQDQRDGLTSGKTQLINHDRSGIEMVKPDEKHALLVASVWINFLASCDVDARISDIAAAVSDLIDGKSRNDCLPERITGCGSEEGEALASW